MILDKFHDLPEGLVDFLVGFAFSMLITPLAADLTLVVEQITEEQPELGGTAGAYGQVFSLLKCDISVGVLLGPSLAGFPYESFGWNVMAWTLAVMSVVAVVPIVGGFC